MAKEAFAAIKAGLDDAIGYARGDRSRGKAHRVRVPDTDVARLRKRLGLSQARFASAFGLKAATVRNWEQGIRAPEGPARVLLRVLDINPQAVLSAIAPKRKGA